MTKKDFIGLADALRGVELNVDDQEFIAQFLARNNPKFKRDRWLAYLRGECGRNGGKLK